MTALFLLMLAQDPFDALVRDLGAEDYDVRELAMEALHSKGPELAPRIREAIGRTRDLEAKARLKRLLSTWFPMTLTLHIPRQFDKTCPWGKIHYSGEGIFPLPDIGLTNDSPEPIIVAVLQGCDSPSWCPVPGTIRVRAVYDSSRLNEIDRYDGHCAVVTLELKGSDGRIMVLDIDARGIAFYPLSPGESTAAIDGDSPMGVANPDRREFTGRLESDWVELTVTD